METPVLTPEQFDLLAKRSKLFIAPMLEKTIEIVLTKTLHAFQQPDGLVLAYTGGRFLCVVLNGILYPHDTFKQGAQGREHSAFVQADIAAVKKTFLAEKEAAIDEFYPLYVISLMQYYDTLEEETEALFNVAGVGAKQETIDEKATAEENSVLERTEPPQNIPVNMPLPVSEDFVKPEVVRNMPQDPNSKKEEPVVSPEVITVENDHPVHHKKSAKRKPAKKKPAKKAAKKK